MSDITTPVIENGDKLIIEYTDHRVTIIANSMMDDFPPSSGRERMTWVMPLGKNKYELQLPQP